MMTKNAINIIKRRSRSRTFYVVQVYNDPNRDPGVEYTLCEKHYSWLNREGYRYDLLRSYSARVKVKCSGYHKKESAAIPHFG